MSKMFDIFDEEYIAKAYRRDLLSQGMAAGMEKGRQEGLEKSLRRLISAMGWPLEQAMTFLEIPEEDRPIYREILKNENL